MKERTTDQMRSVINSAYNAATTIKALQYTRANVDAQTLEWAEGVLDDVAVAIAKELNKMEAAKPKPKGMGKIAAWIVR